MKEKKSCKTCVLNKNNKCEIGYKEGYKKGACGAWIGMKVRENG